MRGGAMTLARQLVKDMDWDRAAEMPLREAGVEA
jgi:hypothetical protein